MSQQHSSPAVWNPPIPLAEIAGEYIDAAANLMKALLPSIERRSNWIGTQEEFWKAGCADYQRLMGHTITTTGFRYLYERTLARDGGQHKLQRIELYLSDRVRRHVGGRAMFLTASESDFAELHDLISHFESPGSLEPGEQEALWRRAIDLYNGLIEIGRNPTRAKYALLSFLWRHAPRLAKTENALRVMFDRRLARWIERDGRTALQDGRRARKGVKIAPELPSDDFDSLVFHTGEHCEGRLLQGVRECVQGKGKRRDRNGVEQRLVLSSLAVAMLTHDGNVRVPPRLRRRLKLEVADYLKYSRGERAINDDRCTMEVDHSQSFSDDEMTADDVTLPLKVWLRDRNGNPVLDDKGKVRLVRGQALFVADVRSWCVLAAGLEPETSYNQFDVRTVLTEAMLHYAVPKKLKLEHGIWKRGKLITGGPRWSEVNQDECEGGLRDFGIRFQHANSPQGKSEIERIAGLLQDRMGGEPGFCGRNERFDKPQRTIDAEKLVLSGKAHPSRFFYALDEWFERLLKIIEEYNDTKQNGRKLNGLSPNEAYQLYQNISDPPKRFDARIAWRLAHHKKRTRVTKEGVVFVDVSGQRYKFCGAAISHLKDHEVLTWWNPQRPDYLTLTDMNRRNPITVERFIPQGPDAAYDRPEEYKRELAKVRGQDSYGRLRYRALKAKHAPANPRPNVVEPVAIELGQHITAQTEAIETQRRTADRERARVRKKAHELRMPTEIIGQHGDEDEYLQMRLEAQRQAALETEQEQ